MTSGTTAVIKNYHAGPATAKNVGSTDSYMTADSLILGNGHYLTHMRDLVSMNWAKLRIRQGFDRNSLAP